MSDSTDTPLHLSGLFADLQPATGKPCVLVELTQGNPNTNWTQVEAGYFGGQKLSLRELLSQVAEFQLSRVEVGGGDPLAQPGAMDLLAALLNEEQEVWLNTPADHDLAGLDPNIHRVVRFHTPESGRAIDNRWDNTPHFAQGDQAVFTITSRHDYEWAKNVIGVHTLTRHALVRFVPATADPQAVVDWVIDDALDVRVG